jgi:hypothetical protein
VRSPTKTKPALRRGKPSKRPSTFARMPRSSRPTRPASRERSCSPVMIKRLAPQSVPCASEVDASARSARVGFVLLSSGRDRWPQGQLQRAYSDLGGDVRTSPHRLEVSRFIGRALPSRSAQLLLPVSIRCHTKVARDGTAPAVPACGSGEVGRRCALETSSPLRPRRSLYLQASTTEEVRPGRLELPRTMRSTRPSTLRSARSSCPPRPDSAV